MVDYSKWANLADDSDDERESVLAERVRRGAALPTPPSATSGPSGQKLEVDRSPAGAARLKAELESQLSSLSLEEANEALRQAEATLSAAKQDGKPPIPTENKLQSASTQKSTAPAAAAVPATTTKPARAPGSGAASKAAAELPTTAPAPVTKSRGKKKSNKGKSATVGDGGPVGKAPAGGAKLEAIQKEMAEMMQTLQQVEKAAADAKNNANEVSALVEARRKEVAAAESEQESSKQELDASFARMKSGLQAEAAAGGIDPESVASQSPEELELAAAKAQAMASSTDDGSGAAGVSAFSDALKAVGQGADLASTLGSAHPLNGGLSGFFGNGMNARPATQVTIPQRERAVTLHASMAGETFMETGEVSVQYQFENNAGDEGGGATSSQEKMMNCASDRDFVSVFEESAGSFAEAQSTEQKVCAIGWVPKNANDYLDFNYVDDAQPLTPSSSENSWVQGGKVNLTVGSRHRKMLPSHGQGRTYVACYFGDDGDSDAPPLLLATCRVLVESNANNGSEEGKRSPDTNTKTTTSAASLQAPAVNATALPVRVAIESDDEDDDEDEEDINADSKEASSATDASESKQQSQLSGDQHGIFEDTECIEESNDEKEEEVEVTGTEYVILEQLRNIKCFLLTLPLSVTKATLAAPAILTESTAPRKDDAAAVDGSQPMAVAPSLASVLGFECTPRHASLLWPVGIASADIAEAGKVAVSPSQGAVLDKSAGAPPLQPLPAHQLPQQRVVILEADAVGVGALLPQQVVVAQQGSRLVLRLPYATLDPDSIHASSSNSSSSPKASAEGGNEKDGASPPPTSLPSSTSAAARKHAALVAKRRAERAKRSRAARAAAAAGLGAGEEREKAVTTEEAGAEGGGAASKSTNEVHDNNNDKKASSSKNNDDTWTAAAPGAVQCGFCEAVLALDGALEAARPGPVGMLDDLCWDLMCAACPVLDLSARNLPVPPKVCWITDTALALPPQALCADDTMRNSELLLSVVPTPGRTPLNEGYPSDECLEDVESNSFSSSSSLWALSCRRCLQVVGEADEPIANELFGRGTDNDNDDASSSSRLAAATTAAEGQLRLFRHKVTVTNRPDLGQAPSDFATNARSAASNDSIRASPTCGRTGEHYVSLQLVASAAARHAFQFKLVPPLGYRTSTSTSNSTSSSSSNSTGGDGGGIGLQIQSWTTFLAMAPLHALTLSTSTANWSELWSSLNPVVKIRYATTSADSTTAAAALAAASQGPMGDKGVGGDYGEVLALELDEWREVLAALETSALASGNSRQRPLGDSLSRIGWLKLPMDFDGAAPM